MIYFYWCVTDNVCLCKMNVSVNNNQFYGLTPIGHETSEKILSCELTDIIS